MVICLAPGGQTTTVGPSPSESLFVGTAEGVRRLQRAGDAWSETGRNLDGNHIAALAFDPSSGTIFAATYEAGLFASDNLGSTWAPRSDGVPFDCIFTVHLQQRPGGMRLYVGADPAHLFYSDDLGRTWAEHPSLRSVPGVDRWRFPGPPGIGHVKNVAFDPRHAETIYASIEVGGLLKSVDDGVTWREMHGIDDDVHRTLVSPSNPERIYISGLEGISVSENGGQSWESLTSRQFRIGYPDALLMHPRDEGLMFAGGSRTSPGGWRTTRDADSRVVRSRDGGRNWDILGHGLPEHIVGNVEAMALDVWDSGYAVFAATTDGDVFCSEDAGDHWRTLAAGMPAISKVNHYHALRPAS